MPLKNGKCSICGVETALIPSNNPLVPHTCPKCIAAKIDLKNLEQADFFCRTYNLPFEPNMWIKSMQEDERHILQNYQRYYLDTLEVKEYISSTKDVWKQANIEWEKSLTHTELLNKISHIKEAFLDRGRVKWGTNFTFEELIQLENLFTTTVGSFDVNNPMQIDAIKKACKASLLLDKAMFEGDMDNIKSLTSAYQQFVSTAKIDEMIESAQTEVIRTVADLAQFLEDNNFEFTFYDNEDRDIVDKTIRDMKEHLRSLVMESTGLEQTLEMIQKKYTEGQSEKANLAAEQLVPLEEIMAKAKEEYNNEIDSELEDEEILQEDENNGYEEEDF
jgi:hypothetical protein